MARTNKYTSLNFNDIYDKKPTNTNTNTNPNHRSSSINSTNKTVISNSRIHGNMLVLTRPSPKPIPPLSQPSPPITTPPQDPSPIQPDSISLRPLGRTGSPSPSPSTLQLPLTNLTVSVSPKTNKFVPPHLRPGFHGKEEKPQPEEVQKQTGFVTRPKSGGGYEVMNRPRSSGSNRPFSSG